MAPRLRAVAVRWMLWATISRVGQDGIRVAGRLVLARLLWPDAFGLFTLAVVVVSVIRACCHLEFSKRIVQRPTLTPEILSTAFWTQTALGAASSLVLIGFAGPLASLAGQPEIAPLLRALSVVVLIGTIVIVPRAWLWRQGEFRQLANRGIVAETIGAIAAVLTALAGGGVWSFIVQEIISDLVAFVVLWIIVPWRPHLHWSRAECAELVEFGWPLVGRNALDVVAHEGDRFLIGRLFGPEALGLYALALRVVESLARSLGAVFERVAFPAFARTQTDGRRSRRGFLEAIRFQALVTFPILIALAMVAGDLIPFALGDKWAAAAPFTEVLAPRVLASSLVIVPGAVLLGRGRPRRVLAFGVCTVVAYGLGWSAGLPWGAMGVAVGSLAGALLLLPVGVRLMATELGLGLRDWVKALLPALVGGAAMVAGMGLVLWLVPGEGHEARTVRILAALGAGAISYALPLAPWLAGQTRRYVKLFREGAGTARP